MNLHMMTNLDLVAIYAGINILLLLVLAILVVVGRVRSKVSLGDGGDPQLFQASRVHGNAVEYVPAGLVGLVILGVLSDPVVPAEVIHAGGAMLTAGRILHAIGLSGNPGRSFGRAAGMLLTWLAFLVIGAALIWFGLKLKF
jgi:uncharacterized membrane protein YecN with MAPEG domain